MYIKIRHHTFKETVVKIRKIEADSDSDGDEKHTCSRLQNIIFLYLCFLVFKSEISM